MKGYKAFNEDLVCKRMRYEIGKEYKYDGEPIPCKQGYHFCLTIADCYNYYPMSDDTRICEIEALGDIMTDDDVKYCTNHIKIVKEITDERQRKGNTGYCNTGYCNTGYCNKGNGNTGRYNISDYNTGDHNTGNHNTGCLNEGSRNTGNGNTGGYNTGSRNTGYYNTGDKNTGSCNTGYCNTGDKNTGYFNTGDKNTGNYNTGDGNIGIYNTGDSNTGNCNTGFFNTGNKNTGHRNAGNYNKGNHNTGNYNKGDYNTGDWNISSRMSGCFNTADHNIMMFDEQTDWTIDDWFSSAARKLMATIPLNVVEWVWEKDMTDHEKDDNPSYKTTGGFLKVLDESKAAQAWWDGLTDEERNIIYSLPNFNKEKFEACVGIKIG